MLSLQLNDPLGKNRGLSVRLDFSQRDLLARRKCGYNRQSNWSRKLVMLEALTHSGMEKGWGRPLEAGDIWFSDTQRP